VDGLDDLKQLRSIEQWEQLAERTVRVVAPQLEFLLADAGEPPKGRIKADDGTNRKRMIEWARRDLPTMQPDLAEQIDAMSDGELTVRWLIFLNNDAWDRIAAAAALEIPEAITRLRLIKEGEDGPQMIWGNALAYYLSSVRFDRRVAALRVVEAVRHYAATHGGKLPQKPAQITETPIPRDPLTDEPFEYNGGADSFSISAAANGRGGSLGQGLVFEVLVKDK
jgi:hypothetical protein